MKDSTAYRSDLNPLLGWLTVGISAMALPVAAANIPDYAKLALFTGGGLVASTYALNQKHIPSQWELEIKSRLKSLDESENSLFELRLKLEDEYKSKMIQWESDVKLLVQKKEQLEAKVKSELQEINQHKQALVEAEKDANDAIEARVQLGIQSREIQLNHAQLQLEEKRLEFNNYVADIKNQIEANRELLVEELEQEKQKIIDACNGELERKDREVVELQRRLAASKQMLRLLNQPRLPINWNNPEGRLCKDFILGLLGYDPQIIVDCGDRQPVDNGTAYVFWLKPRSHNDVAVFATDTLRNWIAAKIQSNLPYITTRHSEGLIQIEIPYHQSYKLPKHYQLADSVKQARSIVAGFDSLAQFVAESYHIGLWAETGAGKSTAISNIIGSITQAMGDTPTIKTTIPKIDADTAKIFPHVHWLGVPNSIFGLLEAALEIQYRIWVNEQAFVSGEVVKDFQPILFFIDEINLIFSRWSSINEADFNHVINRFEQTLNGEKLEYFTQHMRVELANYKSQLAKRLLLFCWQTGRSLKVKTLIAGQNLKPSSFGFKINDLANCAYIAFGEAILDCAKYKVKQYQIDSITSHHKTIQDATETDEQLQYSALYCPIRGKAFFGILPPPNYYQWDAKLLDVQNVKSNVQLDTSLDVGRSNVQNVQSIQQLPGKEYNVFGHMSKLPSEFQNLDENQELELWLKLPKTMDGRVKKTEAYSKLFQVKRSNQRKVVSAFIDYLSAKYGI